MEKKVVIAGGTGFIGQYLTSYFLNQGYIVRIISRSKGAISWENTFGITAALENAEMLINLAGKSVDCRYTTKNKEAILSSRIQTTQILGNAIQSCQNPPELWINSSTATIYRHAEDKPMTESSGEIGSGFSVGIATQWEKAFFDFKLPATRQVALRMSIVLGSDGGVIRPLKNLVKLGLGGRQGSGTQRFSWIHIEDLKNIILFIRKNKNMTGVYNCASPNPVTNNVLMKTLRRTMQMPFGIPAPVWLLKIGAVLINTETELVLKSRWVIPEKLQKENFQFSYPELPKALNTII